jgi:hypothetical protein
VNVTVPSTANLGALPPELLRIAEPDETALLDVLRSRISRLMLEEIAANDYGHEIPEHLKAIEEQIISTPTLGQLRWCPREVLELERRSEPDEIGEAQDDHRAAHLKRLFACTILLRNAGHMSPSPVRLSEDDYFLETSAASVMRALRSAVALGAFCYRPALAFTMWLYEAQPYSRLRPFAALSAALLGIVMSESDAESGSEARLLSWVDQVEESCRIALGREVGSDRWMIGLNTYQDLRERKLLLDTIRLISVLRKKQAIAGALATWANVHFGSSATDPYV